MKIQQYLLVLLEVLFPYMLNADVTEDIHFSHIGLEEGLSHSTIFAINQDKGGNLWFATYDGVNKYDGYNLLYIVINIPIPKVLPAIYPVASQWMIQTGFG